MAVAELFPTPDYPAPGGATVWIARTRDDAGLRFARWRPTGRRVRGSILLVGGRAEFIERYFETIAELRRRGFHVVTFDWRGQGGSDRFVRRTRKGHVGSLAQFERDLDLAVSEMLMRLPGPYFGLGHSMGGAMFLDAARRGVLPLARIVALAPMLGLTIVDRPRTAAALARALYWLGFGRAFVPGGGDTSISTRPFEGNRLTTDPVRYARNAALAAAAPHLAIGDPSIGWVHAAFRLMDRLADPAAPLGVKVPVLVFASGDDRVVSTPAIERFAARLKTGSAIILPRARHEILMERDEIRQAFWAAFDAFIPGETIAVPGPEAGDGDPAAGPAP